MGDARRLATGFLTEVQAVHGLPVSQRALGMTQLVVSELVTNAVKYAPGPVMLDLQLSQGMVRVSVWDSDPVLPDVADTDPQRVGRHGLEITLAVSQAYEVRREPVGKRVTAVIALADDPGGSIAGRSAP
ncbi:ATP-binding protein [Streptomyces sp. NPDC002599]|uniref:ATP-binding protein n=1 Tax=Streptomyces sp. NPDC002599 TaxID=3154421 RepID=UPI0033204171